MLRIGKGSEGSQYAEWTFLLTSVWVGAVFWEQAGNGDIHARKWQGKIAIQVWWVGSSVTHQRTLSEEKRGLTLVDCIVSPVFLRKNICSNPEIPLPVLQ